LNISADELRKNKALVDFLSEWLKELGYHESLSNLLEVNLNSEEFDIPE
jgi:hypothetical protein